MIRPGVAAILAAFCVFRPVPLAWAQGVEQPAPFANYQLRLKSNPDDVDALAAMARIEAGR